MYYRYACEVLAQIPHPTLDQFCEIKQINFSKDKDRSLDSWFMFYLFEAEDPVVISYLNFGYLMLHPGTTRFIGAALRPDGPHWLQAILISDRKLEMPLEGIRNLRLLDHRGGETDWNWEMRWTDPVQQWAYQGCFRNEQEFKDDRNQLVLDILGEQKWRIRLPWGLSYTLNNRSQAPVSEIDIRKHTGLFAAVRTLFERLVPRHTVIPAGTDRQDAVSILREHVECELPSLDFKTNEQTIYTLADTVYWRKYAAGFVSSIMHNTDHCVHIHLVNPTSEQITQAKTWQDICEGRLSVSMEHGVKGGSYPTWWGAQRFLQSLELQGWQQILIVDIDSVFRKNIVWPTEDNVRFYPEIAHTQQPGRKLAAGCTYLDRSAIDLLHIYQRISSTQNLRAGYADQIVLEQSIQQLATRNDLQIRTWDRSVMSWDCEPGAAIWTGDSAQPHTNEWATRWQSRVKKWVKRKAKAAGKP